MNRPSAVSGLRALGCGALCSILWLASGTGPAGAEPSIYPTGVTIYYPKLAYNCDVLFDSLDGKTRLIDMDGHVVHTWSYPGFPAVFIPPRLAHGKRGHVLVEVYNARGKGVRMFGNVLNNVEVGEVAWSGKVVWKWGEHAPGGAARENHDISRLPNGDTLINTSLTHPAPAFTGGVVHDQAIYEVAPDGKIVWSWRAADHLREFGFSKQGLKRIYAGRAIGEGVAGFLTINSVKALGPNRWYDAGDKRFDPNNILIGSREGSFLAIIDKKTGRIVWRVGPYYPRVAGDHSGFIFDTKVPRPLDKLEGQHDPNMIPEGLPGAGDILVLDNEGSSGYPPDPLSIFHGSRVLEINPMTKQIVWEYTAEDSDQMVWTFDTSLIGSARRLPNGNTLIDEGLNGRVFQVTPKGKIVWEYVNPNFEKTSVGGRMVMAHWIYRAQPVPYRWLPPGTPHSQHPVVPPRLSAFHLPESGVR